MNQNVRPVATIQSQPNQHRIVLTDQSRASEQVVFEFPKMGPKMGPKRGELEDVENRLQREASLAIFDS
jgi:hypothetical protein